MSTQHESSDLTGQSYRNPDAPPLDVEWPKGALSGWDWRPRSCIVSTLEWKPNEVIPMAAAAKLIALRLAGQPELHLTLGQARELALVLDAATREAERYG